MAIKEKHRKRSRRSSHKKPDFERVDRWGQGIKLRFIFK